MRRLAVLALLVACASPEAPAASRSEAPAGSRPEPPPAPVVSTASVPSTAPTAPRPAPSAPATPAAARVTSGGFAAVKAVLRVAGRAWTKLDPGSVVECVSETRVPSGRRFDNGRERQSLIARQGERVTIRWELGRDSREQQGEIHSAAADDGLVAAIAIGNETVKVPAGEFACRHFRATYLEGGATTTADLWLSDEVPVPVRSVEVNPREETTTTLVRCTLKPRAH